MTPAIRRRLAARLIRLRRAYDRLLAAFDADYNRKGGIQLRGSSVTLVSAVSALFALGDEALLVHLDSLAGSLRYSPHAKTFVSLIGKAVSCTSRANGTIARRHSRVISG